MDIQTLAAAIAVAKKINSTPEYVTAAVEAWLSEHVDPSTGYVLDDTLTVEGAAADAKKAGDEISGLKSAFDSIEELSNVPIQQTWNQGGINGSSGGNVNSDYRIRTTYKDIEGFDIIHVELASGYRAKIFFYLNSTYKSSVGVFADSRDISVPTDVNKYRLFAQKNDGSSIAENLIIPSDGVNIQFSYPYKLQKDIDEINKNIGKKPNKEAAGLRQGGLNTSTGGYASNANRVSSDKAEIVKTDTTLYVAPWLDCTIFWYGNKGWDNFISAKGIGNGVIDFENLTIPEGALYFRINLARLESPSTALAPSDISIDDCYYVWRDDYITEPEAIEISEEYSSTKSASPITIFSCKDAKAESNIPPDSYYAIKATARAGYDAVRFSVFKTTDNDFVAVHDATINGLAVNTDGTAISESIGTDSCSVAELNQYDWGLKFGEAYRGLQVPMLDDCLRYAALYNLSVALDIKNPSAFTSENIEALADMLLDHGHDNAIFIRANATQQAYIITRSPRFSIVHISDLETLNSNLERLKGLMTGENHIYWANTGERTQTAINTAYENGFELTGSADTVETLASKISNGARYIECENLGNAKIKIRKYVDSLLD